MGDMVETDEVGSIGKENEAGGETACERYFTVGEFVEYWEGAYVRGGRVGFGEPAFVKKVVGNGVYAIKMVGSFRGKFRNVGWRSLFKDGSFNNKGARGEGARVRGETRLKRRNSRRIEEMATTPSLLGTNEGTVEIVLAEMVILPSLQGTNEGTCERWRRWWYYTLHF